MSTIAPHPEPTTTLEAAPPPFPATAVSVGPRKRWTTAEFDALLTTGLLSEGSQTYLWDGEIIEPMAENPPHINAVANLMRLLIIRLPEGEWTVNQDAPLELAEGYKPQPDVCVLKGPRDNYDTRVAVPTDVGLLVEIADTSYPKDSIAFLKKYAEALIPAYWIVNIPERRIEVYTDPVALADGSAGYATIAVYSLEERVPLFTRHQGVTTGFGDFAVREILRNSLGTMTKETGS